MPQRTLSLPEADLVHDVHGPLPPAGGEPLLVLIGQPMTAEGFDALVAQFDDRTVVTYDPRGLGRSTRSDGVTTNDPRVLAGDLHALVEHLGAGPVEVFASSGGAVTGLAWVAAYPDDVVTLVAHEPPIGTVLPDVEMARRAGARVGEAYRARGFGAGMAAFIEMTSWQGEFTEEFLARPLPDPAAFGLPTEDDGSRDDPLMTGDSDDVVDFLVPGAALAAAPTRVVVAVGEETGDAYTARTARATAAALGDEAVVFPSHHGGFGPADGPWPGQPEAFAARLRQVLRM